MPAMQFSAKVLWRTINLLNVHSILKMITDEATAPASMSTTTSTGHESKWSKETITLRQGNRARDQFAALLLATAQSRSRRRGFSSHAGVLGPALARHLWDTWVIGTERRVVVVARLGKRAETSPKMAVKFGVSLALLGLTTDVHVGRCREDEFWITGSLCVTEGETLSSPWVLRDTTKSGGGVGRNLGPHHRDFFLNLCVNAKWWVQSIKERNVLAVTNLQTPEEEYNPVVVPIPENYNVVQSMSFNKLSSSQALILMTTGSGRQPNTMIVVVDVQGTYATKSLQIVSSTQCPFPQHYFRDSSVKSLLLLKNKSGRNVFIVETIPCDRYHPRCAVYMIQENGAMNMLFVESDWFFDGMFHQLSGSLFSYHHQRQKRLDIWDCNDADDFKHETSPLRTFRVPKGVLSGGGLVILVEARTRLQIVEATSGLVVASIDFLQPGCNIKFLAWFPSALALFLPFFCDKKSAYNQAVVSWTLMLRAADLAWKRLPNTQFPECGKLSKGDEEVRTNRRKALVQLVDVIFFPVTLVVLLVIVPVLWPNNFQHSRSLSIFWFALVMSVLPYALTTVMHSLIVIFTGIHYEPFYLLPISATSPRAFWGKRWNIAIRNLLHRNVFVPVSRLFPQNKALGVCAGVLSSFLVSALMHEFMVIASFRSSYFTQGYPLNTN
ncbi:hypothetical protein Pelo_18348 [Pelomyxa schiedti]|nr:hypothetical protein Pelo_18348 [Pelomyxa schiedti]